ncbi:hypothetical protein VTK26DRAFT_2274 [Humicola hyalothermophila]
MKRAPPESNINRDRVGPRILEGTNVLTTTVFLGADPRMRDGAALVHTLAVETGQSIGSAYYHPICGLGSLLKRLRPKMEGAQMMTGVFP